MKRSGGYGFPRGHPLGVDRQGAFFRAASAQGLDKLVEIRTAPPAAREQIERFHTREYVETVMHAERDGLEFLDNGDTPVFPRRLRRRRDRRRARRWTGWRRSCAGIAIGPSSRSVACTTPRRESAAGFCVFNDLGVVIETLRSEYGIRRVAYVDIDVHHGDGVFYAYEDDPDLIFADIHEDGRYLYPGTGHAHETGQGAAKGTKLNIPLAPGAGDRDFLEAWPRVVAHLRKFEPQFVLFQCGADGLDGDPLAHLTYTPQVHAHAARSLVHFADRVLRRAPDGLRRRRL